MELRKCIRYLVEHEDVAAELGANGQRFAREVLSVECFVQRVVDLIGPCKLKVARSRRILAVAVAGCNGTYAGGFSIATQISSPSRRGLARPDVLLAFLLR